MSPVIQEWVQRQSFMQQAVLLCALRGPDGVSRSHPSKQLVKWYRRCILYSAFDSRKAGYPVALLTPVGGGGGSFTGPSCADDILLGPGLSSPWPLLMEPVVKAYIDSRDELPAHYQGHMMHAVEIVGYKHPGPEIRGFWFDVYERLAKALHLTPETEAQLDHRLGDDEGQWRSVQVETYQGSAV